MALGFFRRNQKMVMILMVVLMVSFLISYQGMQALMEPNRGSQTYGTARVGNKDCKITNNQVQQAQNTLNILSKVEPLTSSGIRYMYGLPVPPGGLEYAFITGGGRQRDNDQSSLAFALLLQEARDRGIQVTDQDITNYKINTLGLEGQLLQAVLIPLRNEKLNETNLDQALGEMLLVYKSAQTAAPDSLPSEAELRYRFRNEYEKIKLDMVRISATDIVKAATQATQPSESEMAAQFQKYIDRLPVAGYADFGFGYRMPNRAQVAYLFINQNVLKLAGQPTDAQILTYRRVHMNDKVTIPMPASAPASSSASAPAIKDTEIVLGNTDIDFDLVKPYISDKIAAAYASDMTDKLMVRIEGLEQKVGATKDMYSEIANRMVLPADEVLKTPVKNAIVNKTLQDAMQSLASEAGLQAICLPWGRHGKVTIDPKLRVNVPVSSGLTLGGALDQIVKQIGSFRIDKWAMCDCVDNVLFPMAPLGISSADCFPVTADVSQLSSAADMKNDPILGYAVTSLDSNNAQSLVSEVFSAKAFGKIDTGSGQMNVGDKGSAMYVTGEQTGRLLWKIVEAKPSAAPSADDLISNPKLRAQVIEDLKTISAMQQAEAKAAAIVKAAAAEGLQKAALAAGLTVETTQFFNRQDSERALHFSNPNTLHYFIKQAFTLVPEGADAVAGVYPPSKLLAVNLPGEREVVIIQRVGYLPPLESDFQGETATLNKTGANITDPYAVFKMKDKKAIAKDLRQQMHNTAIQFWCVPASVVERTKFKRATE